MTDNLNILLRNNTREVSAVINRVDAFLNGLDLSPRVIYSANLAMEELLTNMLKYSGKAQNEDEITVNVEIKDKKLILTFIDHGLPFNPLEREKPIISDSISNTSVGGLGIYILTKTADSIDYYREGDCNINKVTISLKAINSQESSP